MYDKPEVKQLPYASTFWPAFPALTKTKPTTPESGEMIDASERRVAEIVSARCSPQTGIDNLALDLNRVLGD